ncbi:MAG: hypothetical protein ACRD2O_08655 [Terriglobia bacterium]
MNSQGTAAKLSVEVHEALEAICGRGKGRCWYCDKDLPSTRRAIRQGWDVQRLPDHTVASIILVCPKCRHQEQAVNGGVAEASRQVGTRRKTTLRPSLGPHAIPAPAGIK